MSRLKGDAPWLESSGKNRGTLKEWRWRGQTTGGVNPVVRPVAANALAAVYSLLQRPGFLLGDGKLVFFFVVSVDESGRDYLSPRIHQAQPLTAQNGHGISKERMTRR